MWTVLYFSSTDSSNHFIHLGAVAQISWEPSEREFVGAGTGSTFAHPRRILRVDAHSDRLKNAGAFGLLDMVIIATT